MILYYSLNGLIDRNIYVLHLRLQLRLGRALKRCEKRQMLLYSEHGEQCIVLGTNPKIPSNLGHVTGDVPSLYYSCPSVWGDQSCQHADGNALREGGRRT